MNDKRDTEEKWKESEKSAEKLRGELEKKIMNASENEKGKEEKLYGKDSHSLSQLERERLEKELLMERVKNGQLYNDFVAQVRRADEVQKQYENQVRKANENESKYSSVVSTLSNKLDNIQDSVNRNTVILRENAERLKDIDEMARINIRRITNLLNPEFEVPNLILVVPTPDETMIGMKKSLMKKSGWPSPRKWFERETFDLHIICPITNMTAVSFGIPEPTDFVKKNASLIKTGLMALRYGGKAVKLVAKVASSGLIELPDLDISIDKMFKGMDKLDDSLENETKWIGAFVNSGGNNVDPGAEMATRQITGQAYKKLKEFLMEENRMQKVNDAMEVIKVAENEKIWVSKKRESAEVEWVQIMDQTHGVPYYQNLKTGEAVWEAPKKFKPMTW